MRCFVWNEYWGKKTADEIISVTWQLLKLHVFEKHTIVKIWSDNCVAQNTCWKILFFYAYLVKSKKVSIYLFIKINNLNSYQK